MVLLGEDLGGRQERGLAAGVDHAQHRAQRHERLARADLALEQTVHRVRACQVGLDLRAHLLLTAGELEGEPLVEGRQQSPAPGARSGALRLQRPATAREHQLGGQRLLEAEPLQRPGDLAVVLGVVHPLERLPHVEQPLALAQPAWEQLGEVVDDGEGEGDRALEVPGLDVGGEGVDRVEVAEGLQGELGGVLAGGAHEHHLRVGELPGVAEPAHLPLEDPPSTGGEPALVPGGDVLGLGEEGHRQRRTVGLEHRLHPEGPPVGASVGVGAPPALADAAHHDQHLPLPQRVDLGELTGLDVPAGEVTQQVADRAQPQALDDGLDGLLLGVAEHGLHRRVHGDHGSSPVRGLVGVGAGVGATRRRAGAGSAPGLRRRPSRRRAGGAPRPRRPGGARARRRGPPRRRRR